MLKICEICGTKYETKSNRQKKCDNCRKTKVKLKTCPICETEFKPKHGSQKYCCEACADSAKLRTDRKFSQEYRKKNPISTWSYLGKLRLDDNFETERKRVAKLKKRTLSGPKNRANTNLTIDNYTIIEEIDYTENDIIEDVDEFFSEPIRP
jgi:hypothetical protein